jgi:hypothetical protein
MQEHAVVRAQPVVVNWSGRTPPPDARKWVDIIERVYGSSCGMVRLHRAETAYAWKVKRATGRLPQPPDVNDNYPQDFSKRAAVIMALWDAGLPVELG